MQLILLIVVLGLMHAVTSFAPSSGLGTGPAAITVAAGFILLAGLFAGNLFKAGGLPRLTGYLSLGIFVGPQVIALVNEHTLVELRIFTGVAIALIALTAGTEMDFRKMRPLLRGIAWITGIAVVGTIVVLSCTAYFLSGLLPFTAGLTDVQRMALSFVLGVTISAQSPAVVVALRTETEADGPVSRTVLGVVVLADLVVILMFALATSVAKPMLGSADGSSALANVGWEIFGSIGAGLLIGILVAAYLRTIRSSGALFVVMVGFLVAEVGERVHLDPLLIALSAGVLIRNATSYADVLHDEIEAASLPVYIAFFAVAGATINLRAMVDVAVPAGIFALVRAAGFLLGTRIASTAAGSPETVRRYAGFGLLPQAGLAIALALLFTRTYPQFGASAAALVFGIVGMNEIFAPVIYRWALLRSGEAASSPPVAPAPVEARSVNVQT